MRSCRNKLSEQAVLHSVGGRYFFLRLGYIIRRRYRVLGTRKSIGHERLRPRLRIIRTTGRQTGRQVGNEQTGSTC